MSRGGVNKKKQDLATEQERLDNLVQKELSFWDAENIHPSGVNLDQLAISFKLNALIDLVCELKGISKEEWNIIATKKALRELPELRKEILGMKEQAMAEMARRRILEGVRPPGLR